MAPSVNITFDTDEGIFFANQTVSGELEKKNLWKFEISHRNFKWFGKKEKFLLRVLDFPGSVILTVDEPVSIEGERAATQKLNKLVLNWIISWNLNRGISHWHESESENFLLINEQALVIWIVFYHFQFSTLGLSLTVRGKAVCYFYDSDHRYKRTTETYGTQLFLDSLAYLFGSEDAEAQTFAPGVYTNAFECQLPSDIPYSVATKLASIRYKVVTKLTFANNKALKSEKAFVVARNDDLNLLPNLRFPYEAEKFRTFLNCLCGIPGSLTMKVSVPRTGFALGETIPVGIELLNESSKSVSHLEVSLKKHERFVGTAGDILDTRTTILKVRSPGVGKRKQNFSTVQIEVPPRDLLTSNDQYCKIYQITYEIKIKAPITRCNPPFIRIPIVIGHVGIRSSSLDEPIVKLKYMSHPNFRMNWNRLKLHDREILISNAETIESYNGIKSILKQLISLSIDSHLL